MASIMEAKLVISANDKTGPALQSIENRIAAMNKAAAAIGSHSARVGALSSRVAATQAAVAKSAVSSHRESAAAISAIGGRIVGLGAVVGAGLGVHEITRNSMARIHERVREQVAGMSAKEISEAEQESADLAAKFPSVGQTTFMHMLRNARSIVGGYKEAAEIMEPLAKLRVLAQAARPGEDVSEDFDQLVKGLEIKGVTQNPKLFHDYMEGIAKGLNVFGDTLKPYQYYEMFKYGRQATPALSEKFILGTAPTLAQELGGSSYGKAVAAFNSAIVGGVMKHASALEFVRLGLVADSDIEKTKTGDIKGLKAGSHVAGWRLAQTDPNEWVKQILLPALTRAGITQTADQIAIIGRLFQNQTAAQMAAILTTQQTRIDKDLALLAGAHGLDAANLYQSQDPTVAFAGLKNALEGLGAHWGSDMATAMAPTMNDISKAIAGYTAELTRDAAYRGGHPGETTLGQKKFNRYANLLIDGISSDLPRDETLNARNDRDYAEKVAELKQKMAERAAKSAALAAAQKALDDYDQGPHSIWDKVTGGDGDQLRARRNQAQRALDGASAATEQLRELNDAHEARQRAQGNLIQFQRNLPTDMDPHRPLTDAGGPVPGGSFSLARGYRNYDPATGFPTNVGPAGKIEMPKAATKLEGAADIAISIKIDAPELLHAYEQARTISASGALRANTGTSMPEAAPTGISGN